MDEKKGFVYTQAYFKFDYGRNHPLRIERLQLAHNLMTAYGLFDLPDLILKETEPALAEEIAGFHRPEYLDVLRRCGADHHNLEEALACGLGPGDNPVFDGVWDWSLLTTGASLMCARMVADGRTRVAFNPAGGLHHAQAGRASGFCYINDIVIAVKELVDRGLRVAYVDIDAHHGDGVESAFADTDRVLTISLHQHGRSLFPGTGYVFDTGRGRGRGYSVNVPLLPGSDDQVFIRAFEDLVPDLIAAYRPDVLVTQLGADMLRTDPLTDLCLTTNGFAAAVRSMKNMNLPWLALGGGGYHIVNVARAWTLAWAVMNDVEPPDDLPEPFLRQIRPLGYREQKLRDEPLVLCDGDGEPMTAARQAVDTIRRTALASIDRASHRAQGVVGD